MKNDFFVPRQTEVEELLRFLERQRNCVFAPLEGLSEARARQAPSETGNSVLGIMNHLAFVERRWIDAAFLGGERVDNESEFAPPPEDTMAVVIERYRATAAHTDEVVRASSGADERCHHPDLAAMSLRWLLLHLIEETARHAGHADIARELIDGHTGD